MNNRRKTGLKNECRWGEAGKPTYCPNCGSTEKLRVIPSGKPLPYHCGDCNRAFSVKTGSVMHRSKISFQNWVIAIFLMVTNLKSYSSTHLARELEITQKSAHFLAHRIREAWSDSVTDMEGTVEVDESYFGGKVANMPLKKQKELQGQGRGTVGKAIVVGLKNRETGKIVAKHVHSTSKETLQGMIKDTVREGSTIYSDEYRSYQGLENEGYKHETVNHGSKEYVKRVLRKDENGEYQTNGAGKYIEDKVHINGMEGHWSMTKRAYHGTHHWYSFKHLDLYIQESATRHNMREDDTIVMMQKTVAMMIGKRLMYRQLVDGKDELGNKIEPKADNKDDGDKAA